MKKIKIPKIKPIKRTCGCGNRIIGHHVFCNKCWKKKQLSLSKTTSHRQSGMSQDNERRPTKKFKMKENKKYPYKKTRKKPVKIATFILFLFSLFGLFIGMIIIHENSHRWDYRNIDKLSEEICYLEFNENFGHYSFTHNQTQQEEIDKINERIELRAAGIELILGIIYIICFFTVYLEIKKNEKMTFFVAETVI